MTVESKIFSTCTLGRFLGYPFIGVVIGLPNVTSNSKVNAGKIVIYTTEDHYYDLTSAQYVASCGAKFNKPLSNLCYCD
jgi:ABC-type glucose/galactose transport system permease subunit